MTIGRKIWGGCGGMAVLTAVLGWTAIYNVGRLHETARVLGNDSLPRTYLSGRLNTGAKAILIRMSLHMQSDSATEQAKYQKYLVDRAKQWRQEIQEYERHAADEQERKTISMAKADFESLLTTWTKILPVSAAHQHREAFAMYEREAMGVADRLDETVKSMVSINKKIGDAATEAAEQTSASSRLWTVSILAATLMSGGVLVLLIAGSVSRALHKVARALAASAQQVAGAASRIATSSEGLARGASEQAGSLEETSASTDRINAMAQRNAEHSRSAAGLVEQSQAGFLQANESLSEMLRAMDEISQSNGRISKIIAVIDEIAFQTNILALNAAVEAARAGESGMGFAVVAGEVRNLAQRSAQAAKDTADLIEESITRSNGGKARVERVAQSLKALTGRVDQIREFVGEIRGGSDEQARGVREIAGMITQMEHVTQGTAAKAEESAGAAEELRTESATLNAVVKELLALVEQG